MITLLGNFYLQEYLLNSVLYYQTCSAPQRISTAKILQMSNVMLICVKHYSTNSNQDTVLVIFGIPLS